MPSDQGEQQQAQATREPAITLNGRRLETAADAARWLGASLSNVSYALWRAPDATRYAVFEIPKRSGGMRTIRSPRGDTRRWQTKLAAALSGVYQPHPGAHGFIPKRSVVTNALDHAGQRHVLNIDLEDFFPSVNFGRVRGLFMAEPFFMAPAAATIFAQLCTFKNGLPQGAPTSPALSNLVAHDLDRRLMRLAKEHRLKYTRYADDITFSSNAAVFPPAVAVGEGAGLRLGEALERAIAASGFTVNAKKVRLQRRGMRQSVTGLTVNEKVNIERTRVRRLRAMIHAWEKFGLDAAAREHFAKYAPTARTGGAPADPAKAFRNVVYGHLAYVKMVRGKEDALFIRLASRLAPLDPNPSKFVRQIAFGADDFDVFISHASEDKEAVARPIYEACTRLGLKVFLDESHIAWGESFASKINVALGAARTVLCVVSPVSVQKEWPVAEVNAALSLDVSGEKTVVPLIVGKPDLSRLPLLRAKDWIEWSGDADLVARRLQEAVRGRSVKRAAPKPPTRPSAPMHPRTRPPWAIDASAVEAPVRVGLLVRIGRLLFGRRPPPAG